MNYLCHAAVNTSEFISAYQNHPTLREAGDLIDFSERKRFHLSRTVGSAFVVFAAYIIQKYPSFSHVFVLNNEDEANYFFTDLEALTSKSDLHFFPDSFKKVFYDEEKESNKILRRTETLDALLKGGASNLMVSYTSAIAEKVIDQKSLQDNIFLIRRKDNLDVDFLSEFLNSYNFERVDFVFQPGQYAVRGGIIDVFSFSNENPLRIELDGEEIDTIREFDTDSQLSVKFLTEVNLVPDMENAGSSSKSKNLFHYLPQDSLIWTNDWKQQMESLAAGKEKCGEAFYNEHFWDQKSLNKTILDFTLFERASSSSFKSAIELDLNTIPQTSFQKNFNLIASHLKQLKEDKYQVFIFSENGRQIERLLAIFEDIDRDISFIPLYKGLSSGYIDHRLKIACYTEHQLFDRYYRYKGKKSFSAAKALTLRELKELHPGDYITHIDHGIGKFAGLAKVEQNGTLVEAVRILYRDNDNLFVHINSLHKISKYIGKDGTMPKLNKLGSDAWDKLKLKTKGQVKDIARDLIKLYAARKSSKGFSFTPDTYLQTELEASFIYEDTPDQAKSTADVKKDMESLSPMDRLVCGDVGFGKTEVAIRAAFKAVADSKQVAILVPTTILAYQHYKTFKDRLRDMPCNIDYVSRHRTAAEKKKIYEQLTAGKIDIIIGTHALTSKDVKFKDLGLLVIDEEQKFGVAAKEKLKQLRVNIDTLTLTATPIPRTLHFSLMGARDLSVINTPPPNRQPVRTEIHVYNPQIIKDAVDYEIARGGQVFFIHNRVKDIYEYKMSIELLCPGIRVAVAHGQMQGDELEDIMIKFVENEFDVLIATTIIESGIDIPNANTIIINNAHMFGLSDLHQMRGRVGRSNKKAYCYLFSPPLSTLTDEAKKRLTAIEQFADLGSGFSVAMRDLDIRGAGNLLGGEQSGFIAEIGFEMYQKILDEAVHELKEEEFPELVSDEETVLNAKSDCQVESDLEILIPDDYVTNIQERLSLYTELANVKTEAGLQLFAEMLKDRFGPLPEVVLQLLNSVKLKWIGDALGLEKIAMRNKVMTLYFPSNQNSRYYSSEIFGSIIAYISRNPQMKMKQTPRALMLTVSNVYGLDMAMEALGMIRDFVSVKE